MVPTKAKYFHGSNKVKWFKKREKNEGIKKMDRSSTIASIEGGSSMIQQPPHVLGAKAYCVVDLEYILKKNQKKHYIASQQQNQYC